MIETFFIAFFVAAFHVTFDPNLRVSAVGSKSGDWGGFVNVAFSQGRRAAKTPGASTSVLSPTKNRVLLQFSQLMFSLLIWRRL